MAIFLREYFEFNAENKNEEWANQIVRYMRKYVRPIVDPVPSMRNKAILFGRQGIQNVMDMFRTPERAHINFMPLTPLETVRKILITQNQSDGTYVSLTAVDPTATNQKKEDRALLENRKVVETLISQLNKKIGLPQYSLDKDQKGNKVFNGNVNQFDEMGLDDNEKEDISHFFSDHYRLDVEIQAETAVNAVNKDNELDEFIPLWVNDILANNTMVTHSYVSDVTGKITVAYLEPWEVRGIKRKRLDYKDSPVLGWERNVSVREFIAMMGNAFNANKDMPILLRAVFFSTGIQYTGITQNGIFCWGIPNVERSVLVDYYEFLQFSVAVGYMEWKSNNAKSFKVSEENKFGNYVMIPKSPDWKPAEHSQYKKESWYNEMTYKSYYLITSTFDQVLYKYGLLNNQHVEGSEDEYSNFSIVVYQEQGKSAVEVAYPYIELLEKAYKKFEWMVVRAKPPGRSYNYEGLINMAKQMFPENGNNVPMQADRMLNFLRQSSNEIYMFPQIDGQTIGGGGQVNFDMPNGLAQSAMEFWNIYMNCMGEIQRVLGTAPIQPNDPQPREALGLNKIMNAQSNKATYYIRRMLTNSFNHLSIRTIAWIQDIIQFRDKSTLPYKYLVQLLGVEVMEQFELLNNIALHRYQPVVDSFYDAADAQQFETITLQALANKEIGYDQYLLIKSIKNPKRAFQILSYEKKRTERIVQKQQEQQAQAQQQLQQAQAQQAMQLEQLRGQNAAQQADINGKYMLQAHQIQAQGNITRKEMDINAQPQKTEQQKNAKIEIDEAKKGTEVAG